VLFVFAGSGRGALRKWVVVGGGQLSRRGSSMGGRSSVLCVKGKNRASPGWDGEDRMGRGAPTKVPGLCLGGVRPGAGGGPRRVGEGDMRVSCGLGVQCQGRNPGERGGWVVRDGDRRV